ncbi:MAG: elongation factor P [Firmicutes bacterium]|nr:elongation factor P [Bacillota bacterium]
MISSNDFHNGVTLEIDGEVYTVVDFQHVKPGKGSAFVRTKLKNARTGAVIDRTFNAGEKVPRAQVEKREVQYLYANGDEHAFMDSATFDQFTFTREQLGEALNFMTENMTLNLLFHGGRLLGVELPNSVTLRVVETDPGVKGDTAAGGTKPARLETGYVVRVPLFVNPGDELVIDTRTGAYLSRA